MFTSTNIDTDSKIVLKLKYLVILSGLLHISVASVLTSLFHNKCYVILPPYGKPRPTTDVTTESLANQITVHYNKVLERD